MHFKVTARTILQLGAELISSDAIAFYELIKNSFDAGSPRVEVRICIRLDYSLIEQTLKDIDSKLFLKKDLPKKVEMLVKALDYRAPDAQDLLKELEGISSKEELKEVLRRANFIAIRDTGEGMTLKDLDRIYLTIGTRNRYEQREHSTNNSRPILGEKGLGRLSVMRLGDIVQVETTKAGEATFNLLDIDWTVFSHDSNDLLESVEIMPEKGRPKRNRSFMGTNIFIYDLKSRWSKDLLEEIGKDELSRFIDPFQKENRDFIGLWFNNQVVHLGSVEKDLVDNAQAIVRIEFKSGPNKKPLLEGTIDYKYHKKKKTFFVEGTHLASITGSSISILQSLGPFTAEAYWYNRQRITLKNGYKDHKRIKDLLEKWNGGIMVYRDGFRVNPYGGPQDDWLKLDPRAFRVGGYKLNRKQLVGKLEITSKENPKLIDQTNREGLRDNPEKMALISILYYVIWDELKVFLEAVEKDEKDQEAIFSLSEIEERVKIGSTQAKKALDYLIANVPGLKKEEDSIEVIRNVIDETKKLVLSAKASSDSFKYRLETTIHLAGLGLMVDIIGHELTRATQSAGKTLSKLTAGDTKFSGELLTTLRYQLKTIETRLKVLDPLGPSGRQRKEGTDIPKLIISTLEYHRAQFERHHINLLVTNDQPGTKWELEIVPGMLVQIIENLVANSVYWLKQEVRFTGLKKPEITVSILQKEKAILFSDNGPGINKERSEDIFEPFYTTKPPRSGKGLGLYISREIAEYNDASLFLQKADGQIWRTFVLDLSKL